MPAKKTTKKSPAAKSKLAGVKPSNKLANVKVTITHIVPTTQFGNVSYKAECDAAQAEDVGVLMTELISRLYPPFNPGDDIKATIHTDSSTEAFNREVTELNLESKQEDISTDDFDF